MSFTRRCDICDGPRGTWEFRKRWKIFQTITRWFMEFQTTWTEELDVCDDCIEEFKKWRIKKRELFQSEKSV